MRISQAYPDSAFGDRDGVGESSPGQILCVEGVARGGGEERRDQGSASCSFAP